MKEYILARVVRQITKQARMYTVADMRRIRKAFAKHFQHFPSPFITVRGEESFLARVPVVMTMAPETPEVITIGRETFVRVNESPLTYRGAIARKAVRQK